MSAARAARQTHGKPGLVRRVWNAALWVAVAVVIAAGWPTTFGGQTGYVVVSGTSMLPTYHTGDLLLTRAVHDAQVGQVVVYVVPQGGPGAGLSVVHRVIGGNAAIGWTTRGDNNPSADIWTPHRADITGRVVVHVPHAGMALMWLRSPLMLAFAGAVVVGWIVWPAKKETEKEAAPNAESAAAAHDDVAMS